MWRSIGIEGGSSVGPVERSCNGLSPVAPPSGDVLTAGGNELPVEPPRRAQFLFGVPESDRQACQECGAESGGLDGCWPQHPCVQKIGLHLHKEIVPGRAAVNSNVVNRQVGFQRHRLGDVRDLVRD